MNSREELDTFAELRGLNKEELLGWSIAADFADYYADHQTASLREENDRLRELMQESALQIEYLHDKFKETGSGNATLSKIKQALNTD